MTIRKIATIAALASVVVMGPAIATHLRNTSAPNSRASRVIFHQTPVVHSPIVSSRGCGQSTACADAGLPGVAGLPGTQSGE